jgi:hydrogenase expression/formation protein HypC
MCLGIPGRIVSIRDAARLEGMVEVSGVRRAINLACVAPQDGPLEDLVGTYVLVHVGFAMSRIDEEEAAKTLEALRALGEADEEIAAMGETADLHEDPRPNLEAAP